MLSFLNEYSKDFTNYLNLWSNKYFSYYKIELFVLYNSFWTSSRFIQKNFHNQNCPFNKFFLLSVFTRQNFLWHLRNQPSILWCSFLSRINRLFSHFFRSFVIKLLIVVKKGLCCQRCKNEWERERRDEKVSVAVGK